MWTCPNCGALIDDWVDVANFAFMLHDREVE